MFPPYICEEEGRPVGHVRRRSPGQRREPCDANLVFKVFFCVGPPTYDVVPPSILLLRASSLGAVFDL